MKLKAFTLCFFLSLFLLSYSQDLKFRGFEFGTSISMVKQQEKSEFLTEQNGILMYKCLLKDHDFSLLFSFSDNKLMGGGYLLDEKYKDEDQVIDLYSELTVLLIEKYGSDYKIDDDDLTLFTWEIGNKVVVIDFIPDAESKIIIIYGDRLAISKDNEKKKEKLIEVL